MMKLEYYFDLSENSNMNVHTPSLNSQLLPFYIHRYGNFEAYSGYYTKREGLENFLLFYTISGSGVINYRNSEFLIKPDQAAIVYCKEYHYYKTGAEGLWKFKWIHFNGTACMHYFNLINGDSFSPVTVSNSPAVNEYMDKITEILTTKDMLADIKCSMYLTNILSELIVSKTNSFNNKNYLHHNDMVEKAIVFINNNYSQKINLDNLTDEIHVAKYHFIRIFKSYTGMSPYEYLINVRINKSMILLKETDYTVGEIAYRVGFNDTNNFIKCFKKLAGTTPLRYRNYWIA